MPQAIVMPKLGLTMTEGTLKKWYKKEGDAITLGEIIFEVETDKLTNSVESSQEGILRKVLVSEGVTVNCFVPVGVVGTENENIDDFLRGISEGGPAAPQNVSTDADKPVQETAAASLHAPSPAGEGRVIAAPAARKMAQEKGVDLTQVAGTGPGGRITIADVEKYIASSPKSETGALKTSPLAAKMASELGVNLADVPQAKARIMSEDVASLAASKSAEALEQRVPMSGMRKIIAKRMRESVDISPSVTLNIGADMTAMKACKAALASEGLKVSYTDLLVKIVSKVLMEFPLLNSTIDGTDIIYKRYVNMGVAVALDDGLVVPVIKNTHIKTLAQISDEIKNMAAKAKEGKLGLDSLTGGTFTISNLGMFGIESFTPIINQPEVAILGVNSMSDTVVCVDGEIIVRPMMRFSLTADHRAVDGAVAAHFLSKFKKYLEMPALLFME